MSPAMREDMKELQANRLAVRHIEHFHYSVDRSVHLHFEGALSPEIIAALGEYCSATAGVPAV